MYAVGKVAPSLAYSTNELATHMSNPSEVHWKAMKKLVGFMKGPHYIDVLILRKPKELRVVSGADAAHSSAAEDRLSTMGEIHTLGGAYINSGSRKIRCITLSSTESEIHAMSTAGQQVKFMQMLLDECILHKEDERLVAWLYNDNLGGLFLANNKQVSMRTKHIDIRALFIRELKQTGVLDVFYEKSEYLLPDLLSKNLAGSHFTTHQSSLQLGTMMLEMTDCGVSDSSKQITQMTHRHGCRDARHPNRRAARQACAQVTVPERPVTGTMTRTIGRQGNRPKARLSRRQDRKQMVDKQRIGGDGILGPCLGIDQYSGVCRGLDRLYSQSEEKKEIDSKQSSQLER
jgi:hypothetical protein